MGGGTNCKPRGFLYLMELPITDNDLNTIVRALSLGGDTRLYFLLKQVKESREGNNGQELLREVI